MKFIDFKKLKDWAYSIPTYEQPFWDKVDEVLDAGTEKAFANPVVAKGVENIKQTTQAAKNFAEKHFTKLTKENNEN